MYTLFCIFIFTLLIYKFASGSKLVSLLFLLLVTPDLIYKLGTNSLFLDQVEAKKTFLSLGICYFSFVNFRNTLYHSYILKFILIVNIFWTIFQVNNYVIDIVSLVLIFWLFCTEIKADFSRYPKYLLSLSWIMTYSAWNTCFSIEYLSQHHSLTRALCLTSLHIVPPLVIYLLDKGDWFLARGSAISLAFLPASSESYDSMLLNLRIVKFIGSQLEKEYHFYFQIIQNLY